MRKDNYPEDIRAFDSNPNSPFYTGPPMATCLDCRFYEDGVCTATGDPADSDDEECESFSLKDYY